MQFLARTPELPLKLEIIHRGTLDGHHQYFLVLFLGMTEGCFLALEFRHGHRFYHAKWADRYFLSESKHLATSPRLQDPPPLASVSAGAHSQAGCLAKPLKGGSYLKSHTDLRHGERQSMWRPSSFLYPCCLPGCLSKSVPPDWTILSIFT